jgi:NDP-sugar pyrophosphorylase family protein
LRRTAALVLAAGRGTRLRPLTDVTPKPLLTVLDVPIIDTLIGSVLRLGVQQVFVNLFHEAEQIDTHLAAAFGAEVHTRTEPALSGPAGALRLFADELGRFDEIVVLSGDLVFDDDLKGLIGKHRQIGADLTFGVTYRKGASRYGVLDLDEDGRLLGAREKPDVADEELHAISAGVYCLSPAAVQRIPGQAGYDFAANLAPDLMAEGGCVFGHVLQGDWSDIGQPKALFDANLAALENTALRQALAAQKRSANFDGAVFVGEAAEVATGAVIRGPAVIGKRSAVGEGCWVERCVLMPDAVVPPGVALYGALVAAAPAGRDRR